MKLLAFYLFFNPLWFDFIEESPTDFEYKLSNLANNFEENIMSKDECRDLMNEASSLGDEIEDEIDEVDEHSANEISAFKELKKKADALENYIGVVAGISTTFPKIAEFEIANSMVGGSVLSISQGKFCVDIVSVNINNYVVYLVKNTTTLNYRINYSWKASGGLNRIKSIL